MKRRSMLCMIAAAFLLCWGGVVSCSSDSSGDPPAPEVHDGVWKINENAAGFVKTNGKFSTHKTYTGYDGEFIDYLGADSYIDYAINSAEEQNVTILLHYAYWGTKTDLRGAYIVVNGVTSDEIIYCDWTNTWQDSNEITIHLKAGDNALRVVPVPADTPMPNAKYPEDVNESQKTGKAQGSLPNIDYLQITGNGLSAGNATATAYYRVKASGDFGTVDLSPKQDYYAKDTKVTLTATPKDGYKFDAWWGTIASNNETWEITVTEELNLTAHFIPEDYTAPDGLVGYATITADNKDAKYTITGGAGAADTNKVTISTYGELKSNKDLLASHEPKIITIRGTISTAGNENPLLSEKYTVGSNTTIYGDATNQGRLQNIELSVEGENVIIRNMMLGEVISWDKAVKSGADDALSLNGATHVWIDHCELQSHLEPQDLDGNKITSGNYFSNDADWKKDFYDGLLDIKNGSTWITISNCYFHDHWKACLCSSGDGKADKNPRTGATDVDMRVTFYGNYWENINSRQPLFRWGKAHIYNNYYKGDSTKDANCIDVRINSQVLAEGNYFASVKNAIGIDLANGKPSTMGTAAYSFPDSNKLENCTNTPNKGNLSYAPKYEYDLKPADEVTTAPVGVGVLTAADLQ